MLTVGCEKALHLWQAKLTARQRASNARNEGKESSPFFPLPSHSRFPSRAAPAGLFPTPPNGELAHRLC